ncbi:hypothetical protein N7540_007725 [Penicillium herquei]|nr:hypothetical protein N7540_007725 [Penicillium herquei]
MDSENDLSICPSPKWSQRDRTASAFVYVPSDPRMPMGVYPGTEMAYHDLCGVDVRDPDFAETLGICISETT